MTKIWLGLAKKKKIKALFIERWNYDEPPEFAQIFLEDWNYSEPPAFSNIFTEEWSS